PRQRRPTAAPVRMQSKDALKDGGGRPSTISVAARNPRLEGTPRLCRPQLACRFPWPRDDAIYEGYGPARSRGPTRLREHVRCDLLLYCCIAAGDHVVA